MSLFGNGPYKYGQYAPDEKKQPFVRLWDEEGDVVADFPATKKGWKNAKMVTSFLNGESVVEG